MPKRYVLILTLALAAAAVLGYALPDRNPVPPRRILLPNVQGRVVFEHARHMDAYGLNCGECHHADGKKDWGHAAHVQTYAPDCQACHHGPDIEPEPMACGECHAQSGEPGLPSLRNAVHARCESCHAEAFAKKQNGCAVCHAERVTAESAARQSMPPGAAACTGCHNPALATQNAGAMEAFHESCMGCHKAMGIGPYAEDACGQCHTAR